MKLITIDKQELSISCPDEIWEDVWDSLQEAFCCQGLWNCGNWSDLVVMFGDYKMDMIDMHKIIGTWG